jgi:hypothetical protein
MSARLERIEGQAKPRADDSALVEIKALRSKVEELERAGQRLEPVPALVQRLTTRLDGDVARLVGGVTKLDGDVSRIEQDLIKFMDSPNRVTLRPVYATAGDPTEIYLKRGVALFKQSKYAAAREVFQCITEAAPGDARAWYYAALANAFVTGVWDNGETMELAGKGAQCERATADRSKIDAAFASLDKAAGADWITFYRSKANEPVAR